MIEGAILARLKASGTIVIVYLMNGFQLKGTIQGFDNAVVHLMADDKERMIYKHAISTIELIQ